MPDSTVFTPRRYALWKALDWADMGNLGTAGVYVAKANERPTPDPFPDDFPGQAQLLSARIPLVGWEDLIGASARDIMRACPGMGSDAAARIVSKVEALLEEES